MKELHRITRDDILTLLGRTSERGVLSLYVGIPAPERRDPGHMLSAVRSGLTDLLRKNPGDRQLAELVDTAHQEIGKLPPETRRRSLVYFRSLEPDWVFWRSIQPCVPDLVAYTKVPQVTHLVSLLDESPNLGVAVVAQDRARVFSWKEGIVEEHTELVADSEPTAADGPGHAVPPNRAEDRTRRGLRRLATRLAQTGNTLQWQKLLLVGPGAVTGPIFEQIPENWRHRIIHMLDRNMINAPLIEINDLAGKAVQDWRRRQELSEITTLIDEERSGGRATTGVAASLDHLYEGRVETLYLCSDLDLSGFSDADGRLYLHAPAEAEGSAVRPEPRLVERMIVTAMESGAAVVPVEGEPAHRLSLHGGVAARLRWKEAGLRLDAGTD